MFLLIGADTNGKIIPLKVKNTSPLPVIPHPIVSAVPYLGPYELPLPFI
jgi:hypothetical protein